MITVKNLNKFYNKNKSNEIHVINDVNLELPNNGLVAFLGASGSGKTTLLNVIGGLDKATGNIAYDSFEMQKYSMSKIDKYRNENFGYVFQTYNLLLNETVYDNLKIALELIDIYDEDEVSSRIEYALKSVGLYKYRKKKASQLSGGQQQRVAIARALVKHCKVIIADEPTGNLDSANAVEVMNILKSISKKTLVLLVTHNEALANFYSDYIYKIEDGKIIEQYENAGSDSLQTSNDNVIYLKDMNLTECGADGIGVKLYSDEPKAIEIEIVERNNTFYIRSNKNLKLVENSNIRLLNEHYKPIEKTSASGYDYDDSFFNNSVKRRNVWQDVWANIKRSFLSFISPTKKVKMLYTALTAIGVLFAICAISISNALKVDTKSISADAHYSTLSEDNYWYYSDQTEILNAALQNGEISSLQKVSYYWSHFSYQLNYVENQKVQVEGKQMYYNPKVNTVLYGQQPSGNGVAISKKLADELLTEFSKCCNTYADLFDLTIGNSNDRVVGIVDCEYRMVYVSEERYLNDLGYGYELNTYERYYKTEQKYNTYEIVAGRDLTEADENTANILVPDTVQGWEEYMGQELPGWGFVVGIYRMKDVDYGPYEMIHATNLNAGAENYYKEKQSYNVSNYHVVEGRAPEKDNECLVCIYSDLKVGDSYHGYKIVGRYNAKKGVLGAEILYSTSAVSIDSYYETVFIVDDAEALETRLNGSSLVLKSMYQNEYDILKMNNAESMTIYGILGGVCLISASIMVFFLMRSKMINDIYNIGVYRSLGSNKWKIYLKYVSDTLVMVTFTALIAYVLMMAGYLTAIDSINDFFYVELFSRGLTVPLLGVLVLYGINLFFGLLPIVTLLRKTPSEILVKYDI